MPQITVQNSYKNQLIIDASGNHGRNGSNGVGFCRNGGVFDGNSGDVGENGEDSSDVTLFLSSNEEKNIIEVDVLGVGSYTIPLYGKIIVKANGGSGGNGGDGGNGHRGMQGEDGMAATEYCSASNGQDGGCGGNGGSGGNGGHGGKAGNVTIKVKQKDRNLVQLVDIEMKGGDGGYGGRGGERGLGGPGGQGGGGYNFSHTRGWPGRVGYPGLAGKLGENGDRGDNGFLNVEVEKDLEPAITVTALSQEVPHAQLDDSGFSKSEVGYNPFPTYSNPYITYPYTPVAEPALPYITYPLQPAFPTELDTTADILQDKLRSAKTNPQAFTYCQVQPITESSVESSTAFTYYEPFSPELRLISYNNPSITAAQLVSPTEKLNVEVEKDKKLVITNDMLQDQLKKLRKTKTNSQSVTSCHVEPTIMEPAVITSPAKSTVVDHKQTIGHISDDRLILLNNLLFKKVDKIKSEDSWNFSLNTFPPVEIRENKSEKSAEVSVVQPTQEAPGKLPAIEPITELTVADHKRPVNHISHDRLVDFNNLLFGKIHPILDLDFDKPVCRAVSPTKVQSEEKKSETLSEIPIEKLDAQLKILWREFNELYALQSLESLRNAYKKYSSNDQDQVKSLKLGLIAAKRFCIYTLNSNPNMLRLLNSMIEIVNKIQFQKANASSSLIQAVNEIKQQNSDDKSPSLGKLILNSLNKDTTRYLAKSQRNSEDVDSEEYKRQIFTNWCILAISNANNEPKLIKKALELLKARIIKLKAYYSWGSFFTPNSVKNINELLNRSELRGVVGIHSKDLAKQLEEDEKYFKSLIEQRARAIEQLAIEDKILQWRDPSDDDCSNSKIWRW